MEQYARVAVISFTFLMLTACEKPERAPAATPVSIRSSVPQATILIDGKPCGVGACEVSLTGAKHEISTRLLGYKPVATTIDVSNTSTLAPVLVSPEPRLTTVRVTSNLNHTVVALDKGSPRHLENGYAEFAEVPGGAHVLRFRGGEQKTDISFTVIPGDIPTVAVARGQSVAVTDAAVLGTSLTAESTLDNAEVRIDGRPDKLARSRLSTDVPEGNHEMTTTAPDGTRVKLSFDAGPVPTLLLFVTGLNPPPTEPGTGTNPPSGVRD